jgi:hypothetical protein
VTIEGVDFSYARPGGAALVAAGKHFVVRYIRPGDGRSLTTAEIADYRAHGLAICLVFESTANRALSGKAAGAADAISAQSNAAALGIPTTVSIYFAVDFDAAASQYVAIDAYLQGAASVIGLARTGIYGHAALMAHCQSVKTASRFWQTYAWSRGTVFPGYDLYQYLNGQTINGSAVDFCRALKADYGQWKADVMQSFTFDPTTAKTGTLTVSTTGHSYERIYDSTLHPILIGTAWTNRPAFGPVKLVTPIPGGVAGADRATGYLVGSEAAFILNSDCKFTPSPATDCGSAVKTATDPLNTTIKIQVASIAQLQTEVVNAKLQGARDEWDRQGAGATVAVKLLDRP